MVQRKIKVLIITYSFPTKYNPSAAIFILNQLQELKKYCDIKVIFPYPYVPRIRLFNPYHRFSGIKDKENVGGIEVYHPKYFMFPRLPFIKKFLNFFLVFESFFSHPTSKKVVKRIMNDWNPDIIHMHSPLSGGLLGLNIKKMYNKPLLVTIHGEDITLHSKKALSKYLVKSTLRNSNAIICVSEFLKKEINSIGIKKNKFFVIPMGANTKNFKPKDKNKARQSLNLPKDKKIILFVGHLVTRKGVEYLIRSIKIVLKKDKNILCCIVGKGILENALKKLTSELNLEDYVRFLGEKRGKDTAKCMNACDMLVLPSLNEGLPVVLCEALACGKPVVATKVAGTPELVNKDVGYLVKPKDVNDLAEKIVLALDKKWEKDKLLKRAGEFSVISSVNKLIKVYRSYKKK